MGGLRCYFVGVVYNLCVMSVRPSLWFPVSLAKYSGVKCSEVKCSGKQSFSHVFWQSMH